MNKIIRDGHVHSHYCPHGCDDSFDMYIKKALENGLKEITFTEHLPLPDNFIDKEIIEDSAPSMDRFNRYFLELKDLKRKYEDKIKIKIGVEVDYLEGLEKETESILNRYGRFLEDGIISVHFLKIKNKFYAMDFDCETFDEIVNEAGGLDKVYDLYFETLIKSLDADIGRYKPKRVGHPTLVRIFNKKFSHEYKNDKLLEEVAKKIKEKGFEVDFNTAGLRKPYCKEVYPSGKLYELLKKYDVKMVYGSDAHKASDVSKDFNKEV